MLPVEVPLDDINPLLFPPVGNMYFDHGKEKKHLLFQIMEQKN